MPQVGLMADKAILDAEMQKEITDFLSKKRKDIIDKLSENKKLSHGELAEAVDTSVASLSNILIKFDQFKYKLLDSINSGKYRYYFLSDLGNAYVERCREDENDIENEKIVQHEVLKLMQEARECLAKFQNIYKDDWEMLLDDALIVRINYCGALTGEDEILIDKFIENIEKIMLSKDETLIEKVLKLLSGNAILQGRLTLLLDKFDPFCILLQDLKEEENTLQIYETLEAIIENKIVEAKIHSEKLNWTGRYEKLSIAILQIVNCMEDKNMSDIYECFCRYLAGNRQLSAFLTSVTKKNFEKKLSNRFDNEDKGRENTDEETKRNTALV